MRGDGAGPRGLPCNLEPQEKLAWFYSGTGTKRIRKWRPRGLRGGGDKSARRKRKAYSGDARSRGVLPTWALAIGRARADVPAAARARTAERAAPHCKSARRARSRVLARPCSPPTNPLVQFLFAPSWSRPRPTSPLPCQAGGARKVRHVTADPASSSRSHIELELEEASPVSKWR